VIGVRPSGFMLPRARRGLAASVMGIALALSGLPAFPPAVTIAAAPNVAAAADPGPSVCAGAVFQFPLRGGRLGWMFGDPRASGTDPSVIHSGIDLWPEPEAATSIRSRRARSRPSVRIR